MAEEALRILVIDASSVSRQNVAEILRRAGAEVKTAANASIALNRVANYAPSLLIVDLRSVEPDAAGFFGALDKLATPRVVAIVEPGRPTSGALALRFWATLERDSQFDDAEALTGRLRDLLSRFRVAKSGRPQTAQRRSGADPQSQRSPVERRERRRTAVICMGASTGGPAAIERILSGIGNAEVPGVVIAQHMTDGYIAPLAARLARATGLDVLQGERGMAVRPRSVILAPGNRHIELIPSHDGYAVDIVDSPPVQRFRPSIDVLFHSAAKVAGADAIGVILTGMQKDGAEGLKAMHDRGAYTIAQNEQTCAVFSMPRAAIALEGVDQVAALDDICRLLLSAPQR
jgi:two-component system, chemotaxis family, protein-glutamate methylesterase/glutaminase